MKIAQMLALAMLLGSIPFKQIAVSLAFHRFSREHRHEYLEKKRSLSSIWIVSVLILSAMKGFIPVWFARCGTDTFYVVVLTCIITMLSHCFPYWLMFKYNDSGMPVILGMLTAINLPAGLCVLGIWLLALLAFNRLSAAAMAAAIWAPIWLKVFNAPMNYIWLSLLGCAYVIFAHSSNLAKLADGTEPKYR